MATMGLLNTGANNPIFQASQTMAEQAGHEKNMAIQGIINQHMQNLTKQVAAQMQAYSVMAQSKDPQIRKMAISNLLQLGGKEPIPGFDQHLDEAATLLGDMNRMSATMKDMPGGPDAFKQVYNNFLSRFGTDYISPEQNKIYQQNLEQGYLNRANDIGSQANMTPSLKPISTDTPDVLAGKQEAMNYIKGQQVSDYSQGGQVGEAEAKKMLENKVATPKEINLEPTIDAFLTRKFGSKYVQGTPEDKKAMYDYVATSQGQKELDSFATSWAGKKAVPNFTFLPTAEGFVPANTKQGTVGAPTGLNKPLPAEMITTEQQLGTVKNIFDRVKESYNEDYTGPVEGRLGSLKSATIGNATEQAAFISNLQDLNNTLVYLKSGKQINEQEYERLKAAMPHVNLADSDFKARMGEFEKTLNSIMTERQKNMGGYGRSPSAPVPQSTGTPGLKEWMDAAKKANPNASNTELIKYYQQKYGKGK